MARAGSTVKRKAKTAGLQASAKRQNAAQPSEAPSLAQWKKWTPMERCNVVDQRTGQQEVQRTFAVGDDILVLNDGWVPEEAYPVSDAWVGRIRDIRCDSPQNVWLMVQWYWAGSDISEPHDPTQDALSFGKFERSRSQVQQLISLKSVNGKATVVPYDEKSVTQVPIPEGVFYTRRPYHPSTGAISSPVEDSATCLCARPYNPDDPDAMHFCARRSCRRWYHKTCLHAGGHVFSGSCPEHAAGLLDLPPWRRQRVPAHLLALACTPIVRGGERHGVAGNIRSVFEARARALLAGGAHADVRVTPCAVENSLEGRCEELTSEAEVEALLRYRDREDDSAGDEQLGPMTLADDLGPALLLVCPVCKKPV
ncbi:hypothetical protein BC834DRAFT_144711 [Gloeopeniophorella convolvens]|nr:hypothetical protein BC834DRAFT_144711 [Gloeopeniophorella convolvens]